MAKLLLSSPDDTYSVNAAGRIKIEAILKEMQNAEKHGHPYWEGSTRSTAAGRSRIDGEDRAKVAQWVQMPSRCAEFDIRTLNAAHEVAMFALFDITKVLQGDSAVKPAVAYEYLKSRYKTISVEAHTFRTVLSRKSHSDKFQRTDEGKYYLTQSAEQTVQSWLASVPRSESA